MLRKLREGFAEENVWLLTKGSNTAPSSRLRKGEACLAPTGRDVWAGHCPTLHVQISGTLD
jgi:hypothetical protein